MESVNGTVIIVYYQHDSGDLYHEECADEQTARKYIKEELEDANYCWFMIEGKDLKLDYET